VLVFVLKKHLPAGGGQAAALAAVLDRWAQEHPAPYLGQHWPHTERGESALYIMREWRRTPIRRAPGSGGYKAHRGQN
jgi:hypothetical protein